ncbi:hypothetical protein HK097_009463 [Rhizophlyctis rosea]|uniref:Uncharacterized protein n=1 Tax=Rhizophlyctis rosea TaxID=64517 RepID=A0AAD5SAH9_9FUNG|nr:hypothetical protein HK097_009463 [Rhizophlyctis rosea]
MDNLTAPTLATAQLEALPTLATSQSEVLPTPATGQLETSMAPSTDAPQKKRKLPWITAETEAAKSSTPKLTKKELSALHTQLGVMQKTLSSFEKARAEAEKNGKASSITAEQTVAAVQKCWSKVVGMLPRGLKDLSFRTEPAIPDTNTGGPETHLSAAEPNGVDTINKVDNPLPIIPNTPAHTQALLQICDLHAVCDQKDKKIKNQEYEIYNLRASNHKLADNLYTGQIERRRYRTSFIQKG